MIRLKEAQRAGDPCALLTKAEAESALSSCCSTPVFPGERREEGHFSVCSYQATNKPGWGVSLHFFRNERAPAKAGRQHFEELEASLSHRAPVGIEKIGDRALWIPNENAIPANLGTLYVRKGDHFFSIIAGEVEGHPPWMMARELARNVLRDLPD
ncbi:MAG TPA: hypothetical protein VHI98_19860 [Vicinamibacterales bacterium]|jgi:hypothetical protein|nr:hypothetical protein [Vicinamibacterales bacterium]